MVLSIHSSNVNGAWVRLKDLLLKATSATAQIPHSRADIRGMIDVEEMHAKVVKDGCYTAILLCHLNRVREAKSDT